MGVNVDKAGGDEAPFRVDLLATAARKLADGYNAVAGEGHIGLDGHTAFSIGHCSATNDQIIRGLHEYRPAGLSFEKGLCLKGACQGKLLSILPRNHIACREQKR